jgi:hypothetical protein
MNCHTNVTRKFEGCGVFFVVKEKFKQGNKHRKSVGKQIGEKAK